MAGLTVVLVVIGFVGSAKWYDESHAPRHHGSSSNRLFEIGHITTAVPQFLLGGFTAYDDPVTIAYFVRIEDKQKLANPIPWLRDSSGQVFVDNRLVPRKRGVLQLFIDDGRMSPLRVCIPIARAEKYFNRDTQYFDHFTKAKVFWESILHGDELLKSANDRAIAIQNFAGDPAK